MATCRVSGIFVGGFRCAIFFPTRLNGWWMGLIAIKRMAAQEERRTGKKIKSGDAHNTILGLISASVRNTGGYQVQQHELVMLKALAKRARPLHPYIIIQTVIYTSS